MTHKAMNSSQPLRDTGVTSTGCTRWRVLGGVYAPAICVGIRRGPV